MKKLKAIIDIGWVHINTENDPVQVKIILAAAVLVLLAFVGAAIYVGVSMDIISFHWGTGK